MKIIYLYGEMAGFLFDAYLHFERVHYNSMTFEFEREDEAREFHERFG